MSQEWQSNRHTLQRNLSVRGFKFVNHLLAIFMDLSLYLSPVYRRNSYNRHTVSGLCVYVRVGGGVGTGPRRYSLGVFFNVKFISLMSRLIIFHS